MRSSSPIRACGGTVLTNEYDGNHHRIVKDVNGGDTFDFYYNDKWQLIVEAKNGSAEALYAWHLYYIDALAVRFRADDKYVFLHDANFNVTAAFDVKSGSGTYRQVVERYAYTPYGEVTFLDGDFSVDADQVSDIDNQHFYTGRERDPETGLQLNRRRWYHAPLGRWVSRDPIGYAGGLNLYGYVRGTPILMNDPLGLVGGLGIGGPPWPGMPSKPPLPSNEDIIIGGAPNRGLPIRLIEDLKKHGSIWWVEDTSNWYSKTFNRLHFGERHYKYWNNNGRLNCPNYSCYQWGNLYNELWHAWWDQVLEERAECKWLHDLIKQEAANLWANWLINSANYEEMAEEAMSETLDRWIHQTCDGGSPTLESTAFPPGHNERPPNWTDGPWQWGGYYPGDKWYGNQFADNLPNAAIYELLLHAMHHGCDRVGKYAPPAAPTGRPTVP